MRVQGKKNAYSEVEIHKTRLNAKTLDVKP